MLRHTPARINIWMLVLSAECCAKGLREGEKKTVEGRVMKENPLGVGFNGESHSWNIFLIMSNSRYEKGCAGWIFKMLFGNGPELFIHGTGLFVTVCPYILTNENQRESRQKLRDLFFCTNYGETLIIFIATLDSLSHNRGSFSVSGQRIIVSLWIQFGKILFTMCVSIWASFDLQ